MENNVKSDVITEENVSVTENDKLNVTKLETCSSDSGRLKEPILTVTNERITRNTIKNNLNIDGNKNEVINNVIAVPNMDSSDSNSELEATANDVGNKIFIDGVRNQLETFQRDFQNVIQSELNTFEGLEKSSLGQLAQYGSSESDESDDSDEDSSSSNSSSYASDDSDTTSDSSEENDSEVQQSNIISQMEIDYRNNEECNVNSDSSVVSSDTDDSSDSDSESSQKERNHTETKTTERKQKKSENITVKGELNLNDLPPIENLQISISEDNCTELGVVTSIIDQLVVIEAFDNMPPLDIDTVLFLNKGADTLGKIFDVFGPVNKPMYTVRFNTKEDILNKQITVNTKVYCAPSTEHTSYVLVPDLMKVKGSDASWKDDREPPIELLDFSDDDEERRARAKRKNKDYSTVGSDSESNPNMLNKKSAERLSAFEKRKNERNIYLNEHFKRLEHTNYSQNKMPHNSKKNDFSRTSVNNTQSFNSARLSYSAWANSNNTTANIPNVAVNLPNNSFPQFHFPPPCFASSTSSVSSPFLPPPVHCFSSTRFNSFSPSPLRPGPYFPHVPPSNNFAESTSPRFNNTNIPGNQQYFSSQSNNNPYFFNPPFEYLNRPPPPPPPEK